MRTTFSKRRARRAAAAGLALAWVAASAAFGQKAPSPGTHITVSKTTSPSADMPDVGMFKTIQEAVNAATNGQVIEILDTGVYEEQVTIDGRDVSPWDGNNGGPIKKVVGKKNGITIRYVPTAAERAAGNYKRPTIKYKDTQNQSPKNYRPESETSGELPGSSGNFETCGALRIIRAQSVTIDGIAVDGGGQALFAWPSIWNNKDALVHGNAAIALVVAGGAIIRNCDLRNAYIGINVKDRNTGGVFGMRNPADPEDPVPLSGFGRVGYHLIEYNRIHDNALGIFFESAWDLGSTVRYNLIYNNANDATSKAFISGSSFPSDAKNNMASGAMMFKDMVYSPVAIYNNTFYRNEMNFIGHWKVGAPHLLFNNIFGKSTVQTTTNGGQAPAFGYDFMAMDGAFQYRMHNSTFSAYLKIDGQGQDVYVDYTCSPQNYDTLWIRDVTIWNSFATAVKSKLRIDYTYCGKSKEEDAVVPGALLTGGARGFPTAANVRWLEMSKQTVTAEQSAKSLVLPDLFLSTDTANPKFLWPDWEHQYVKDYIQNKGWETIGISNADNKTADLGAISSNNNVHQPTLVRIKPTNVVLLSGTTAKASFFLTLESGTMTNPKIKFLRWVAPLPNNYSNFGGSDAPIIPSGDIRTITPPTTTLNFGSNNFDFTVPQMTMRDSLFGFFEIVVEGTNANGQPVVSDVGFLPYRNLDYKLDIRVFAANAASTSGNGLDTVRAGEAYKVVVTPKRSSGGDVTYTLNEVTYDLLSDATAFMYNTPVNNPPQNPLVQDVNLPPAGKTYNVYFTRAGAETIMGAGVYDQGDKSLVFLGTKDLVVKPGAPDHVVFLNPIPKAQLGGAPAPVINRGVDQAVTVEVQDMYGNAVDVVAPVSIVSSKPDVGDAGAPGAINTKTVNTDKATGIATFAAKVTNGKTGDVFDITATLTDNGKTDTASLRVGRALDRLEVFYSDTTAAGYDPDAKIEGKVGEWFKVTVKDLLGDDVNTTYGNPYVVSVSSEEDGLVFSAAEGGASATEFSLTGGVAAFWVSSPSKEVNGACIDVIVLTSAGGEVFGGISGGGRCEITFIKPSSSIERAIVFGDGHGRPDSLLVYYAGDAKLDETTKPSKVSLTWPSLADGVEMTASGAALTVRDEYTLHVNLVGASFSGIATQRPSGYTSISGQGRGLVKVYGADAVDGSFDVLDGIGPVLARDNEAGGSSPTLIENLSPGTTVDTLLITVSEQIRDVTKLNGATLLYSKESSPTNEPGASGGTSLNVVAAFLFDGMTYKIAVDPVADGLAEGNWIRLDPNGGVTDRAAQAGIIDDNKPHAGNRWVQLKIQEVAPNVKEAWYTANPATGKVDYAYVVFDKAINLETWFTGGSVNFDKAVSLTADKLSTIFSLENENTLKIDLAAAYESSQKTIKTSGAVSFTLSFAPGKGWGADVVNARDKAAPVLADAVTLKIGSIKDDGTPTPDTLVVVFSEEPDEASLALSNSITIYKPNAPQNDPGCKPVLKLHGPVVPVGQYYKANYLIEGALEDWCNPFPEVGDSVGITAGVEFGDNVKPDNNKVIGYNLKQPLKIERDLKWTVKVKSNPFRSGDSRFVGVNLSPSAKGLTNVNVSAKIMIFDNLGALVLDTLVKDGGTEVDWKWEGTNKKGRRVGTGTYLFKAVCEAAIKSEGGAGEQRMPPYAVTRSLGVVRGKE